MAKRSCLNEVCSHRAPQASLQLSSPDPQAIMVLFISTMRMPRGYGGLACSLTSAIVLIARIGPAATIDDEYHGVLATTW